MTVNRPATAQAALALGALGVVFGDIGTSPLYTVQTVFNPADPHPVPVSAEHVYGIVSLIFWSVTIIVTVTYVLLVMRADNDGEGGIMAMITLIRRRGVAGGRRTKVVLAALGVFGASLFFGDSVITPAISVLSAVEGVKVAAPSVASLVVPITAAILVSLFLLQRLGTGAIGRLFGPVMGIWFTAIGVIGASGVAAHPGILEALSPSYAISFLTGHFTVAFFSLAAVVLAVTGAEALYADMGHFGRRPITRVWLLLVFPACILSYLGQGALVLASPGSIDSPFFLLAPGWARLPMVFLAMAATVIASQAVISGAFSVAQQAAQLGYLPRLRIVHTSEESRGQIYAPWINWALLASVLTLVFTFRSSAALAYAFGMAVTGTITITTLVFFYIARCYWHQPLWLIAPGATVLLVIDLLFLAANLTKLVHGAWLPLLIAIAVFTILTTWQKGRELVTRLRQQDEGPLQAFVDKLHAMKPPLPRSPEHSDAVFEACRESGARTVHASAPPNAGQWAEQFPDDLLRLRAEHGTPGSLVTVRMGIDLRRVRPAAKLMEYARAHGFAITFDGVMGPPSSAEVGELGVKGTLGPDVTLVHCTDMSELAWRCIAESGAHVTLAPTSDEQLGLADGVPPVQRGGLRHPA